MKRLKKRIAILSAIIALSSCFSGCTDEYLSTHYFTYDYETNKERVIKIDLIDYTPDAKIWVSDWGQCPNEKLSFDESRVAVQEVLSEEKIDSFLYELSLCEVYQSDQDGDTWQTNTPCGRAVRLLYDDGSFDLISIASFYIYEDSYSRLYYHTNYTSFSPDGTILTIQTKSDFDWHMVVAANYFDTKIQAIECDIEYIELKLGETK